MNELEGEATHEVEQSHDLEPSQIPESNPQGWENDKLPDETWVNEDFVDEAAAEESTGGGRSLLGASATPAIGTMLSRTSGLVRVAALTTALGLSSMSDIYNLANTAPNILYELVIGGVLSSTLVPLFVQANQNAKSDPDADDATSVMVTVGFVAITLLALIAVLFSPWINRLFALTVRGSNRAEQLIIGDDFLMLLLPQIFFYGITTLATAMLHARRRFAAPAFAPVLTNLIISLAALFVYKVIDPVEGETSLSTVYVLAIGTTAGVAAMAAALIPALRRADISLRWDFRPRHPAVRSVLRLSGWTVGFAISNQIALLIVLTLARGAGTGAVSAYQYAFIFFQLPYGLIAVSLMTAVLPELATAANNGDTAAYVEKFREGLSLLLTFMIPAAAAYFLLGRPLIALLLQRGEFDAAATKETLTMLIGFSVGMPAFAVFLYCVRALHARRNTRTPFYLNLFENALNVALVIPLVAVIGQTGLSLAYSLAYCAAAVAAVIVLNRHVHGLLTLATLWMLMRSLLVSACVIVALAAAVLWARPHLGNLGELLVGLAVAIPVFAVATLVFRPYGFDPLVNRLRRRSSPSSASS